MQRDATRQPAGANKEEGWLRMDACGGCATKGDARRRHVTIGDATTSRRTRDKREERRQQTRGDGASTGRCCTFKGGCRVKRMRGGGINMTTSRRTRDYHAEAAKATATVMAMGNAARRHHGTWRRPQWSSRLRLQPCSLRTTPMAATMVLLSSTPPAEFLWDGVAQSIKAVQLDRRPAPPWWCC